MLITPFGSRRRGGSSCRIRISRTWSRACRAGREYSRSAARKTFTREQLREAMAGIEYRDTDAFIDEIPQAYKPIDRVMTDAEDLVTVRHTLRQLVNVKGD